MKDSRLSLLVIVLFFLLVYCVSQATLEGPMFDPGEFTVKQAISRLSGLSVDDLKSVLESEIDGKHRSSLVAEIGRAIDSLKTEDAKTEEDAKPSPAKAPAKRVISELSFYRLSREARRGWRRTADGSFEEL